MPTVLRQGEVADRSACPEPPLLLGACSWLTLPALSGCCVSQVAVFRHAMQLYSKRVAIAAVGVRPWVNRLQVGGG